MFRLTGFFITLASLLAAAPIGNTDAVSASIPSATAVVALEGQDLERWLEAVSLFEKQGMILPPVDVVFSPAQSTCDGNLGLFRSSSEPLQIFVCDERLFVLVHELAHAWMHVNTTDAEREAYIAKHHLPAWKDHSIRWSKRGVERAAVLMQTVLTNDGGPESSRGWMSRREDFELLVGRPFVPATAARDCAARPAHPLNLVDRASIIVASCEPPSFAT